ncbi:MAG: arsenite efflux transporter metallochaperone ArsD [Burkholderiales bacterium]
MPSIQIFDPALCCSTGVCGVDVDQQLVSFAADLDWARQNGAQIERINLAQQPQAFVHNAVVRAFLESMGHEALPLILIDGKFALAGGYPSRQQLAEWAGIASAPSIFTEQVAELVAIGAAIASNCEPCFKYHYGQARKLGVEDADMRRAVDLAQKVKESPARAVIELASRYLDKKAPLAAISVVAASSAQAQGSCCGPNADQAVATASKCC